MEVGEKICHRWSENAGLFRVGAPELRPHALDELAEVLQSQLI